jgi:hypothetical protein
MSTSGATSRFVTAMFMVVSKKLKLVSLFTSLSRSNIRVDSSNTSNSDDSFFLCMINPKLDRIGTRKGCRLAHSQLAGIVLLKLNRCTHAVVAYADRERRSLLSNLKCPMSLLNHIWHLIVLPRIGNSVDYGSYGFRLDLGCRHGGQPSNGRSNWSIILPGRHIVVDLIGDHLSLFIECELYVGKGGGRLRGPLQILGAHPLHTHRFFDGL